MTIGPDARVTIGRPNFLQVNGPSECAALERIARSHIGYLTLKQSDEGLTDDERVEQSVCEDLLGVPPAIAPPNEEDRP